MTDQKPVISDAEVRIFRRFLNMHPDYTVGERETFKQALSAFLSARVPEAMPEGLPSGVYALEASGFNACRDIILKGQPAFHGCKFVVDDSVPENEVHIVQDGKVTATIKDILKGRVG